MDNKYGNKIMTKKEYIPYLDYSKEEPSLYQPKPNDMGEERRKKRRPKKLNPKQRRFIKNYIETGNRREAAKMSGYTGQGVNLDKPLVEKKLNEIMDKEGLDNLSLVKKHRELLDAQRIRFVKVTTIAGKDLKEEITEPDFDTRARGLDMAYKVKGLYVVDSNQNNIAIIFQPPGAGNVHKVNTEGRQIQKHEVISSKDVYCKQKADMISTKELYSKEKEIMPEGKREDE